MTQRHPAHYPITNVCIVADAQKCPPSYDLLLRSHDKKEDCDLWKDSTFRHKTTRYLCFTRAYPPPSPPNNVLMALMCVNEKDPAPSGFTLLDRTVDTSEPACRKKLLYVKMAAREDVKDALIDIILLTKAKRAPEGYALVGDIHGIVICCKIGPIPLETQTFKHASPAAIARPAPLPPISHPGETGTTTAPIVPPRVAAKLQRADSAIAANPLYDVPFQLNVRNPDLRLTKNNGLVPQILFRSLVDINNEYSYTFTTERSTAQQQHFR